MYKLVGTSPIDGRIRWKKGDIVICINNAGKSSELTEGKKYEVLESFREFNADEIRVYNDHNGITTAFSTRFTTIKLERREKLKLLKISNI